MTTSDQPETFNDILSFDPFAEAEKATGKSYKDDEATRNLGMLLTMAHAKEKAEELAFRDDTHFRSDFKDMVRILGELGFKEVHSVTFAGNSATETHKYFWSPDGILVTTGTYNGTSVNSARAYYEWKSSVKDHWAYIESGCAEEINKETGEFLWVGNHDIREGARHKITRVRENGQCSPTWKYNQFLWLLTYAQEKDSDNYAEINKAILAEFPAEVREAINYKG